VGGGHHIDPGMPCSIVYRIAPMTVLFLVVVVSIFTIGCGGRVAGHPETEPADAAAQVRAQPAERLDRPVTTPAAGSASPNRPQRYYRLQQGQTLYSLARVHGVPVDQVMAANGITDPTHLPIGTVIYIPVLSGTPGSPGPAAKPAISAPSGAPVDSALARPAPAPGVSQQNSSPSPMLMTIAWPIEGLVTDRFGARGRRSHHDGIDIDGNKGDLIRAVASGRVVRAGDEGAYGKTVIVDHGDGIATLYAHASKIRVDEGDEVGQDQAIAEVGRTGNARGTHLHFEVRRNGRPVDPLPLLRSGVVQAAGP
jgi:murein DD-endopeptidase MepM/ murein hydrolase activator NlpD